MKPFIKELLFITLIFILSGCEQPTQTIEPSGNIVKVGVIGSFSGPHKAWGHKGLQGIKTAQSLHPYLDNGDRIELIVEDDRDSPNHVIEVLKKLVKEHQVSAILMLSDSDPVLAVSRISEQYIKTPILALVATHPAITHRNSLISQLVVDNTFQATVAALYVRDELLIDRVAVFSNPNSANSTYLADEFERQFKSVNGEITDRIVMSKKNKNYSEVLKKARSNNPQLLYLPINAADLIALTKEARKMNWAPIAMSSDGMLANVIAAHQDELEQVDGFMATDFFGFDLPFTPFGKEMLKTYISLYGDTATTHSALGAEGYALLIGAMNRCKNPTNRACINKMIRSTDNFTGIQKKIAIGRNGKAKRPLIVNSVVGGELKYAAIVY